MEQGQCRWIAQFSNELRVPVASCSMLKVLNHEQLCVLGRRRDNGSCEVALALPMPEAACLMRVRLAAWMPPNPGISDVSPRSGVD